MATITRNHSYGGTPGRTNPAKKVTKPSGSVISTRYEHHTLACRIHDGARPQPWRALVRPGWRSRPASRPIERARSVTCASPRAGRKRIAENRRDGRSTPAPRPSACKGFAPAKPTIDALRWLGGLASAQSCHSTSSSGSSTPQTVASFTPNTRMSTNRSRSGMTSGCWPRSCSWSSQVSFAK